MLMFILAFSVNPRLRQHQNVGRASAHLHDRHAAQTERHVLCQTARLEPSEHVRVLTLCRFESNVAGGVKYSDDERLSGMHAFLNHLYKKLEMRRADRLVRRFVVSIERQEQNGNPMGQGLINFVVGTAFILRNEKAWLNANWSESTTMPAPRIILHIVEAEARKVHDRQMHQ